MKTIGILGGMGPRITVLFEQMLLERFAGYDQQMPTILTINDGSLPDRSHYLLGFGIDPVPQLQQNLDALCRIGAEVIAMPCNSASMAPIFTRLRSSVQLLNLPALVVAHAKRVSAKRVCLLATKGAVLSETYQELCAVVGIECVVPTAALQNIITDIIDEVKVGNLPAAKMKSRIAAQLIKKLGCDAVILGCTELPSVERQLIPTGIVGINSLAILADACVIYSKGECYANRSIHAA